MSDADDEERFEGSANYVYVSDEGDHYNVYGEVGSESEDLVGEVTLYYNSNTKAKVEAAACMYAQAWARELGCKWGTNY